MIRMHKVEISPRHVAVDGVSMTVEMNGPTVNEVGPGVCIVNIPLICDEVEMSGDSHSTPEPTPIYEELLGLRGHYLVPADCELSGEVDADDS